MLSKIKAEIALMLHEKIRERGYATKTQHK